MGTTSLGIRFLESTDPPSLHGGTQNIAEDVNALIVADRVAIADANRTIVAYRRRTTAGGSANSAVEDEVMRIDDVALSAASVFYVWMRCHPDSTVGTDTVQVTVRYTTDGSTPTITSPILTGMRDFKIPSGGADGGLYLATVHTTTAAETLSLLITVSRPAGTGIAQLYADGTRVTAMAVHYGGPTPITSGADL